MKTIKKYLFGPIIILAFGFLLWNILSNLSMLSEIKWQFNFKYLLLAFICVVGVYLLNAYSWFVVLQFLSIKVSLYKAIKIWTVSNLSRLLPGSVWQYISRVYLSEKEGISKIDSTIALVVEIISNILVGILVICFITYFWELPNQINDIRGLLLLLLMVGFSSLIIFFRFILILLKRILKVLFKISITAEMINYNFSYLPILFLAFLLQFVLAGLGIFYLINSMIGISFESYPIIVGTYAFSWLVGYLTIISPGGLGVQEVALSGLLSFLIPLPVASLIAILFRLMLFITEFIVLGTVAWGFKYRNKDR